MCIACLQHLIFFSVMSHPVHVCTPSWPRRLLGCHLASQPDSINASCSLPEKVYHLQRQHTSRKDPRGIPIHPQTQNFRDVAKTQFKIIHRAYYPFGTNIVDVTQAQSLCSLPRPTLLLRLWECPTITRCWNLVLAYIFKIKNNLATQQYFIVYIWM